MDVKGPQAGKGDSAERRHEDTADDVSIASERRALETDLGMRFQPDLGKLCERNFMDFMESVLGDPGEVFVKLFLRFVLGLALLEPWAFSADGRQTAKITFSCAGAFQEDLRFSVEWQSSYKSYK